MKNILFLCTGNSCRSQIAEGWGKKIWGQKYQFFSAGIKKHGINDRAVKVMKNHDVDISFHESNVVEELGDISFDIVFTVCSDAHETCPFLSVSKIIHVGFDDPPRLTKNLTDESEILKVYDRVCLEIKEFVENLEDYI
jgi:arsenate reductase (thioredoxin)